MTLVDVLNKAAAELPEGAEITFAVEKDAASISANVDGHYCTTIDTADMTMAEQVLAFLEWCKTQADAPANTRNQRPA